MRFSLLKCSVQKRCNLFFLLSLVDFWWNSYFYFNATSLWKCSFNGFLWLDTVCTCLFAFFVGGNKGDVLNGKRPIKQAYASEYARNKGSKSGSRKIFSGDYKSTYSGHLRFQLEWASEKVHEKEWFISVSKMLNILFFSWILNLKLFM